MWAVLVGSLEDLEAVHHELEQTMLSLHKEVDNYHQAQKDRHKAEVRSCCKGGTTEWSCGGLYDGVLHPCPLQPHFTTPSCKHCMDTSVLSSVLPPLRQPYTSCTIPLHATS